MLFRSVFNFQSLFASKNDIVAKAQMLLVTKYIQQDIINLRNLVSSGKEQLHPCVIIDEGYMFVDKRNPIALDFIFEQFKKIRKYNGLASFITQNITDFTQNEMVEKTTAIIKNAQYSIILPMSKDAEELANFYNLNDVELSAIKNNNRGTAFLISSPKSRLCFDIIASPYIRSLFDNDKEWLMEYEQIKAENSYEDEVTTTDEFADDYQTNYYGELD